METLCIAPETWPVPVCQIQFQLDEALVNAGGNSDRLIERGGHLRHFVCDDHRLDTGSVIPCRLIVGLHQRFNEISTVPG